MRVRRLPWLVLLLSTLFVVRPLPAQVPDVEEPLETFVQEIVRLWEAADVQALVDLIAEEDQIILDTGTGIENANSRHAAAALRALFAESETVGARAVRVTLASTTPPRGFGEVAWTFRTRGAPLEQSRSIYVAAARQDAGWRITELRLMP